MDDTTPTPEPVGTSKPKRRTRETRELKVKYEFVVVNGEEGRRLQQVQSQAVFEALLWLTSNPKPSEGDQPGSPRRRSTTATTSSRLASH